MQHEHVETLDQDDHLPGHPKLASALLGGFETLSPASLQAHHTYQRLGRDPSAAIRRLHDLGVRVNGSFVFGMDGDDAADPGETGRTMLPALEGGLSGLGEYRPGAPTWAATGCCASTRE
jgi:hypothetical protein